MENKSKPTAGPWEVTESGNDIEVMQEDGKSVATIISEPEQMANAHLIAAAPELLEAAKMALSTLKRVQEEEDGHLAMPWVEVQKLESSIDKAQGRA